MKEIKEGSLVIFQKRVFWWFHVRKIMRVERRSPTTGRYLIYNPENHADAYVVVRQELKVIDEKGGD